MADGYRDIDARYDPDLQEALERGGELRRALDARCVCGHARRSHYAATGALGSFGGSACEECWPCRSFREARGNE